VIPPFREIWLVDFEYRSDPGERPWVVCMVARELNSGRRIRMWRDELLTPREAPFDTGPGALFAAYATHADLGCFLELGWRLPANVVDLYAEHRVETNGLRLWDGKKFSNGLIDALTIRDLAHMDAGEKEEMRRLVLDGRSWTPDEQQAILRYCGTDVDALAALLPVMAPTIDWPRAGLRGRYTAAVARMERMGTPLDAALWCRLADRWEALKILMIADIDRAFRVYEGTSFRADLFDRYLVENDIAWPRLPSGAMALDKETFDDQACLYPQLRPLYELRQSLGKMRLTGLRVGADGRNRCSLFPFGAETGRNTPSSSEFLFGSSRWMRGLLRAEEGCAVAYIDWTAQEVALAAALSGDERMIAAYETGDPYIEFAKAARLVPPDATKTTHPELRQLCKSLVLGVGYGMGPATLSQRAQTTRGEARRLLELHRQAYPKFWRWSDSVVSTALCGEIKTMFGWRRRVPRDANPRSLMNFPMQAGGAEMMRIAAIAATEAGLEVCCPVHDAFVITAPVERIESDVAMMREIMTKASMVVTGGLEVRTDAEIVAWPARYMDDRGGQVMWDVVMRHLGQLEATAAGRGVDAA
jgi:DNA polymerase I